MAGETTNFIRFVTRVPMSDGTYYVEGYCISTDVKPSDSICIGSKLTEVDTGKVYLFDPSEGAGWTDQSFPQADT